MALEIPLLSLEAQNFDFNVPEQINKEFYDLIQALSLLKN